MAARISPLTDAVLSDLKKRIDSDSNQVCCVMDERRLVPWPMASSMAFAAPAIAQETPPAAEPNLDEVVVTGTRVATRTQFESLAPIDVLTHEALTTHGSTE